MGLELRKPPNIRTGRGGAGRAFVCPWLCGFLSDLQEGDTESGVPSWAGDLCFGLFLEALSHVSMNLSPVSHPLSLSLSL